MNKMVINRLDKLLVTNDAATIVSELEVQHPAAKILLLQNVEELIRTGLHPSEIISGYTKAINKTVEILVELVEKGSESMDVRVKEQVITRMKAAVASKQFGQEDLLCMYPSLPQEPMGSIKQMEKAKVAVFVSGVDTSATETKGTVLIHSAEQLENYAKTEEAKVEELIKAVADSDAKVIVSDGEVGEMALHFCEHYKIRCKLTKGLDS
ncbi:hypothetical protein SLEP1_g43153 [Rubroshorea leprosula]|uniref:Uncharacterized protein n=1 Tax=Rubroshorea leprosula TaxID=152421 RepID=A0AAV5LDL8_9ROSI|nr:hypothetical protein SLEP1_g43153 [Rubroshorea leprosula]